MDTFADISNVCRFCANLLEDGEDNEDADDSAASELTEDLEAFCQTFDDDEEPPLTYEEKIGMITVDDKFSQGSVEVARGGRMTVVKRPSVGHKRRQTLVKDLRKRQTRMERRQPRVFVVSPGQRGEPRLPRHVAVSQERRAKPKKERTGKRGIFKKGLLHYKEKAANNFGA